MAALATLQDYAYVAGVDLPTGDDATRITRLIEMASAAVERWCGRSFTLVEDDEITVQVTSGSLRLPNGPVTTLTSVLTSDGEEVDLDGVSVDSLGFVSGSWSCGAYTVTYSHGFDPIPDDVSAVVANMVHRYLSNPSGVRSENLGDYAVVNAIPATGIAIGMFLSPVEQDALSAYRVSVGRILAL